MIGFLVGLGVALVGWLAGGLANRAADVLPRLPGSTDPGDADGAAPVAQPAQRAEAPAVSLALHYLTLPWYVARGGICPHCGERRPLRAPLLEAALIAATLAGWFRFDGNLRSLLPAWLYAWFLLVVLVVDIEHRRVLNIVLAPAAIAAVAISFLPGPPDPLPALLGGVAGLGLFLLLAAGGRLIRRGAMGMGDVKLAGVIGLMTGFPAVFRALLLGVILGGIGALVLLITRRASRKSTIAYAPYLALGALAVLYATL